MLRGKASLQKRVRRNRNKKKRFRNPRDVKSQWEKRRVARVVRSNRRSQEQRRNSQSQLLLRLLMLTQMTTIEL